MKCIKVGKVAISAEKQIIWMSSQVLMRENWLEQRYYDYLQRVFGGLFYV